MESGGGLTCGNDVSQVTCFQPLRVYVHEQGLVRLCTAAYNSSSKMSSRKNKFSHLTNYAVNRDNANFIANKSVDEDNKGHKWSLRALHDWMRTHDIDPEPIFRKIDKLIVKTLIAVEVPINTNAALYTPNRNTCFELLGFDVMIDSTHKPWLLEVNTTPSLACDTPLDAAIKSQVIRDTLNLVRLHQYSRLELDEWVEQQRRLRMQGERNNRRQLADNMRRRDVCSGLISPLADLTEEDAEVIREAEDEFTRRGEFRRVFPSDDVNTREVTNLFETRRFHNLLLFHWVTRGNALTVQDYLDGKHVSLKNFDPSFKPPAPNPNGSHSSPMVSSPPSSSAGARDKEEKLRKDLSSGVPVSPLRAIHKQESRSTGTNGVVVGGAGEKDKDKCSEASSPGWRPGSHLHSKLSAAQAERNGLLATEQFKPAARVSSPATCSQRYLTLDLAKQYHPGAPPQLPAPQQQQQVSSPPQRRPLQQKQLPLPAAPQSRLPSIPSPQRSPKRGPRRCADDAGVDGTELDLQALDDNGDMLSVASTEGSVREEKGDMGRDKKGFYTLYGMEVAEVCVQTRCGRTLCSPLQAVSARSAPVSPVSTTPSRPVLQTGDRANQTQMRTPGGQVAPGNSAATSRNSKGAEAVVPAPPTGSRITDKSPQGRIWQEAMEAPTPREAAGACAGAPAATIATSPCSASSKLPAAARE